MSGASEPTRVLIVDDTADLRDLLRLALERDGFVVVAEAGDGRQGIDAAREHRPDVILLDLAMPVMDGLEALPTLRSLCPSARIVVLSGFGADQMTRRALDAGADGYLQKGASLSTIMTYLHALTDSPDGEAPARPEPVSASRSQTPPATRRSASPAGASALQLLEAAPVGVIEVGDDAALPVISHNTAAGRLLGGSVPPGTPLAGWHPALAHRVEACRRGADGPARVGDRGSVLEATVRRIGSCWVLYVVPASDEDHDEAERRLAMVAHELRSPAAAISSLMMGLDDLDSEDHDRRRRMLAAVQRQARMLDTVSADLLASTEVRRGPLRLNPVPCDLGEVAREVVVRTTSARLEVTERRPAVADPQRVEQLLVNLLTNAVKHGAPPYTVRIRPADLPDRIALEVEDRGAGVPEDFRDRLFEEFSRAEGAALGNGLGLSVVRSIAEAHHGSVSYAPAAGGGSVFIVTLPAAS